MATTETQHSKAASLDVIDTEEMPLQALSWEEDQRILRKVDKWLLSVLALSYMFQFLDKTALGSAAILGIIPDLKLTGLEYSWASSIYYFGYIVASYPAAVFMVRWKVGKIVALSLLTWGMILMLMVVCHNATGLLVARFFLGVMESPIAPALSLIISMWYKRSEQPLRHAAWFLGNTCAGIFGGLLGYGIGHIDSISPWKAVFLIFGAATVAWSVGAFFLVPDTPVCAHFLSKDDRKMAMARVKDNMTGIKSNQFKWYQCREALCDVKAWLIAVVVLASDIPNGAINAYFALIVKGFGFSTLHTLLLQCVPYLFQLFFVLFAAIGSSRLQNCRTYFGAFYFAISITGAAMVRYLPTNMQWGRYFGVILANAYTGSFPLTMSLVSGNFGGFTKKATVNAMLFIAYCAGNIIGPYLFFEWQAPVYQSGFLAILCCLIISFVLIWSLRFYLIWENHRRGKQAAVVIAVTHDASSLMVNMLDKTDTEIPEFRYVY